MAKYRIKKVVESFEYGTTSTYYYVEKKWWMWWFKARIPSCWLSKAKNMVNVENRTFCFDSEEDARRGLSVLESPKQVYKGNVIKKVLSQDNFGLIYVDCDDYYFDRYDGVLYSYSSDIDNIKEWIDMRARKIKKNVSIP